MAVSSIISRKTASLKVIDTVTVAANGSATGVYNSCDGYDKLSICWTADASVSINAAIAWSMDGITNHGWTSLMTATGAYLADITDVKAPFYKVYVYNKDAGASHVMNAWAYLKA